MDFERIMKADLHVHSKYSEHPSEWLLKAIGTRESYTEPLYIYQICKKLGMDLVTITDHNAIDGVLLLKDRYPADVITGVEATSYFPEDRCKIHVLIYGFTPEQFGEINILRNDIYQLRDYLIRENLAYSIAHATFSVNDRLLFKHLEQLILLFNTFETINGGRNQSHNTTWLKVLKNLTPDIMADLYEKYRIEPHGETPWIKGFTGGSDDHAGLFMAQTGTSISAQNPEDFLQGLRDRKSEAFGRHNEFYSLAFIIYKVGYDHMKNKGIQFSDTLVNQLNDLLFQNHAFSIKQHYMVYQLKKNYRKRNDRIQGLLANLIQKNLKNSELNLDQKLENIYQDIADIADYIFSASIESIRKDFRKLDLINIFRQFSSMLPGVLLTFPFLSTVKHFFQDKNLLHQLETTFLHTKQQKYKKIFWFTDTINDLNGVSVTLKKIGWLSYSKNYPLTLVSAMKDDEIKDDLPPNLLSLPIIAEISPDFYNSYLIKFPSILKSLKLIYDANPDEIIISTPGPIGLLGLLVGKLMKIPIKTIFHSDFTKEFEKILGEGGELAIVDAFIHWFYHQSDHIMVPTEEYIRILTERKYDTAKMSRFFRGIDVSEFNQKLTGKNIINDFIKQDNGFVMLYTGRISMDKELDFIVKVFNSLTQKIDNLYLVICGEGPYLEELKLSTQSISSIFYSGRLDQRILPYFYSGADLLVFPSTTDTFGMSVLEAQACGLPAIVSNVGGPKDIIIEKETGWIAPADQLSDWVNQIREIIDLNNNNPKEYNKIREQAILNVQNNYDWNNILADFFKEDAAKS